MSKTQTMDLVF